MTSNHCDEPSTRKIRVLFVCLGNICRSPLAEGVFRHHVSEAGLGDAFEIDSTGTAGWHQGDPPDGRMCTTALRHGVRLVHQGRQFVAEDLEHFDHILAMDRDNLHDILFLDRDGVFSDRVRLFREYDPEPGDFQVPDPYYGGLSGFESVYEMVERTSSAMLDAFVAHYGLVRHV